MGLKVRKVGTTQAILVLGFSAQVFIFKDFKFRFRAQGKGSEVQFLHVRLNISKQEYKADIERLKWFQS